MSSHLVRLQLLVAAGAHPTQFVPWPNLPLLRAAQNFFCAYVEVVSKNQENRNFVKNRYVFRISAYYDYLQVNQKYTI